MCIIGSNILCSVLWRKDGHFWTIEIYFRLSHVVRTVLDKFQYCSGHVQIIWILQFDDMYLTDAESKVIPFLYFERLDRTHDSTSAWSISRNWPKWKFFHIRNVPCSARCRTSFEDGTSIVWKRKRLGSKTKPVTTLSLKNLQKDGSKSEKLVEYALKEWMSIYCYFI